jgi:hypothetical protein
MIKQIKKSSMKQTTKLVAYLIFMTLVITGSLFLVDVEDHSNCPVCNHSIASEGTLEMSPIATINK